jgi:hypothetical protein
MRLIGRGTPRWHAMVALAIALLLALTATLPLAAPLQPAAACHDGSHAHGDPDQPPACCLVACLPFVPPAVAVVALPAAAYARPADDRAAGLAPEAQPPPPRGRAA